MLIFRALIVHPAQVPLAVRRRWPLCIFHLISMEHVWCTYIISKNIEPNIFGIISSYWLCSFKISHYFLLHLNWYDSLNLKYYLLISILIELVLDGSCTLAWFSLLDKFREEAASWGLETQNLLFHNPVLLPGLIPEQPLFPLALIIEFLDEKDRWLSPFIVFNIRCLLLQCIFVHY